MSESVRGTLKGLESEAREWLFNEGTDASVLECDRKRSKMEKKMIEECDAIRLCIDQLNEGQDQVNE